MHLLMTSASDVIKLVESKSLEFESLHAGIYSVVQNFHALERALHPMGNWTHKSKLFLVWLSEGPKANLFKSLIKQHA